MPDFLRTTLVVAGVIMIIVLLFAVLALLVGAVVALPWGLIPIWVILASLVVGAAIAGIQFLFDLS